MIINPTDKEHAEWKEIYDRCEREFSGKSHAEFEAALDAAAGEWKKGIEAARIAAMANDPQQLLKEIKWQVSQTVETFVSGQIAAEYLNARKQRIAAIQEAKKAAEKITNLPPMPSMKQFSDKLLSKPILEIKEALALVEENIAGLREALKKYPAPYKQLSGLIKTTLQDSPYVYVADKEETGEETRLPLPKFKTYGLMNDQAALQLLQSEAFRQELNGQLTFFWETDQAPASKDPVPVSIALQYTGEETKLSRKMTAFDEEVYNAVSTIHYYYKKNYPGRALFVTPQEIWRIMNGKTDNSWSPSQKQIAKVCASLDKMRFTRAIIDITEEIKAGYISINDERLKDGHFDTYLLKADKVRFTTDKGAVLSGYKIDDPPILYTYNEAKKHILWVPFKLLDTSISTGNTGETVEIRGYLLRQIELMKNKKPNGKPYRDSKRILYKTIYEATGLATPEERTDRSKYSEDVFRATVKKEAMKDRNKVAAILDAWARWEKKEEPPYIYGYKQVKKGREFIGVDIALTEKDADEMKIPVQKLWEKK